MGNKPLTESEFKADLRHLHDAIQAVKREHHIIDDEFANVIREFNMCRGMWDTPSAASFDAVSTWLSRAGIRLNAVLDDMVMRMQTAYDNYKAAEIANTSNLRLLQVRHHSDSGDRHGKKNSHKGKSELNVRLSGHQGGEKSSAAVVMPRDDGEKSLAAVVMPREESDKSSVAVVMPLEDG